MRGQPRPERSAEHAVGHHVAHRRKSLLGRVEALAAFNKDTGPDASYAGMHFDIEPHGFEQVALGHREEQRGHARGAHHGAQQRPETRQQDQQQQ